jgi:hypothetical protein
MVGSMTGSMVGGMTGPLTLRKGGGSRAAGLLRDYAAGFALSAIDMSAMVKGHTTNFNGNANDLLTYASPSTKYVRNSAGVLVPGTTLRLDYDENGVPLGLLIEEQRTNLLLRSEEFNDAAWAKTDATVTANATTAPDGTTTADILIEGATTNVHRLVQTVASGSVFSVFAKAETRSLLAIDINADSANRCYFDLSSGLVSSVGAGITAIIADAGSGWYRCTISLNSGSATSCRIYVTNAVGVISYAGDGTSGIYIWGAQLEAAPFASSYIPTVASQVTRAADNITLATSTFPFNAAEGAIVAEWRNGPGTTAQQVWMLNDGSNNNRIGLFDDASGSGATNDIFASVINGGVAQAAITLSSGDQNTEHAAAMAWKVNDFAVSLDGGAALTDSSGTVPTVTTLNIGGQIAGSTILNGHIRSLTYIPERLSNALLEELSA